MRRLGLGDSTTRPSIDVASRTDRGVSARANAMALASTLERGALLRALNGIAPDIFFSDATEVPAGFRPRQALSRQYSYFELDPTASVDRWARFGSLFEGTIDVRSFGRGLPPGSPARRTVSRIDVTPLSQGVRIDIEAPSFVWGMVRKIISALRALDRGEITEVRLQAALAGRVRLPLPLAEPEALVLWEVRYERPWEWGGWSATKRQGRHVAEEARRQLTRQRILKALELTPT